jgi:hypothetical protein
MSRSFRHLPLFLPSALFLFVCSLTSLSFPVKCASPHLKTQRAASAPGWSVTLKVSMPNGSWIRITERDGGNATIQQHGELLRLFPHVLSENRLSLTARFVDSSAEKSISGETSFEIETNTVYHPPPDWSRLGGVVFDLVVESIQRMSMSGPSVQVSFPNYFDKSPAECCITCGGVTACACAVDAPCGSCCAGLCCNSGG